MGALGETQINCKHDNIINVDACLVDILLYSIQISILNYH